MKFGTGVLYKKKYREIVHFVSLVATLKVKLKQSHYRSGQALTFPGG
jgi:hypothetical protein